MSSHSDPAAYQRHLLGPGSSLVVSVTRYSPSLRSFFAVTLIVCNVVPGFFSVVCVTVFFPRLTTIVVAPAPGRASRNEIPSLVFFLPPKVGPDSLKDRIGSQAEL